MILVLLIQLDNLSPELDRADGLHTIVSLQPSMQLKAVIISLPHLLTDPSRSSRERLLPTSPSRHSEHNPLPNSLLRQLEPFPQSATSFDQPKIVTLTAQASLTASSPSDQARRAMIIAKRRSLSELLKKLRLRREDQEYLIRRGGGRRLPMRICLIDREWTIISITPRSLMAKGKGS